MIELRTNRLWVQIPEPGEHPNTTLRFDRAGFISQVILDGIHSFCTTEPEFPGLPHTGGAGLCSEIACSTDGEAAIGEYFPKFGVGMLQKTDNEPYNFRKHYAVQFLQTEIFSKEDEQTVIFENHMAPCQGYQLKERKTVKADENSITVFYEMENRGKKELSLREYCHNFISIDYYPLGPEYTLKMPVVPQNEKKPERGTGTIQGTDCGFSFTGYADTACAVRINSDEILPGEFYWKLSHSGGMAAVEERVSFKPSWILVWSVDNNISPEVSYCFTLPPGKAISYWRRWTFTDSLFQP